MYNQNNMWPSMAPLGAFGFANQSVNSMPNNSNVCPQNINHLSPYYNPNQGFGQQLNSNYNYYGSPLIPQSGPIIGSPYLSHLNQSFCTNTSPQSYGSAHQKPSHTVTTIQTTAYNTNATKSSEDNKWLDLLNASQKQVLDQLNKETEAFEQQFKNWEKDFESWKQVNRSHPDSSAYQLYVNQWQQWRQKLIERQQQMKDLRTRTLQQLYSQVRPQMTQMSSKPPPPPTCLQVPPPPPPAPPEKKSLPPPPPPPSEPTNTSFVSPLDSNINEKNSKKIQMDNKMMDQKTSEQNSKIQSKDIEVIEIDCEHKTNADNRCETKSGTNADPNAVSKAAETLLFIQKQQELLKSLENLKNVNTDNKSSDNSGDDLQVIEPKPFDIKEIVTKMKAIRPPENPMESNRILSNLPSLQGIVFQHKPDLQIDNKQKIASYRDSTDGSFGNSSNNHIFTQNNNPNALSMQTMGPRFQSNSVMNQSLNPQLSTDPNNIRLSVPPNSTNVNKSVNFMQMSDNRWTNASPGTSREGQHYFRINDAQTSQQPNSVRKYSAQTIDYNHMHENKDSGMEPSVEGQPCFSSNPISNTFNNNFFHQINPNHSFNREMFDNFRKPMNNTKGEEIAAIEEMITYRDMRYFTHPKSRIVPIDDLLKTPAREFRPENIVIILRGLPGSGKTFIAKLIKEKEMEFSRSAPRILSIDDYFMSEVERQTKVPETGKTIKSKEYVYEYEKEMESCYRASLLKTYKKTVDDRLFSFIIIDAVNEMIGDIEDFYSYAIKNDFVVYVIEMVSTDPLVCHKNNIHNRTLEDIKQIHKKWQTLPEFMLRLDIRTLLQNASIKNIEMEVNPPEREETSKRKAETELQTSSNKELRRDSESHGFNGETRVSRWERMEASESKLDKLDSFRMKTKPTIEEYLQVTDDYDLRLKDKQKRVRWADIEEQKKQEQIRQRGFVVGVDWHQYMDPQHPQRVLTETKYF